MRSLPVAAPAAASPFDGAELSLAHCDARPLPLTPDEVRARGWDAVDVVFVSGDAYVDHPSFAMALLGRLLESAGFRVAILSQPDWKSAEAFRVFGRPRLFFAVSAGNMDSMINHYTANKKVRNDDAYSPGGAIGRRPDRATLAYCQRAREAFPGVPIVTGGVEASLRRIAHYDYWSDTVRRSVLMDAKADLLGFGMGERSVLAIARGLSHGDGVSSLRGLRGLRGVAYRLGAKETVPSGSDVVTLPAFDDVSASKQAFAEMTRLAHREMNPLNGKTLVQRHGTETVVVNPPALPLTEAEMDWVYGLPYSRRPHPAYGADAIPAFEVVKTSVQIMRGCFGGCTFCSITAHEGRAIQSRSKENILGEVRRMAAEKGFSGVVSDIGGPTANMYRMRCTEPEVEKICRRPSCVHPTVCKLLGTDHAPLISLMREARQVNGVRKVFIASGIRMDLARKDPEYMKELATHHVGGLLKVAPEHTDPAVLDLMKKPGPGDFLAFDREFTKASERAGKKQHLVPYFIASHPGSTASSMIDLAVFLKQNGYRPDQVQDFIPSPFDIAACMYHTGLDPMTMKPVQTARALRDRRVQRALLQFWKPENWFEVKDALTKAGRADLIGPGKQCLIAAAPPREALEAKRRREQREPVQGGAPDGDRPQKAGYRPHRKSVGRRPRN